ncbi:exported hypothetical protein [Burkholderiales bacterium]|nr:exported hypothetical protein [Burkholderiales bacterium]
MTQAAVLGGFAIGPSWASLAFQRGRQESPGKRRQAANAWMSAEEVAVLLLSGEFLDAGVAVPASFAPLAVESAVSSVRRWTQEGRIFAIHELYPRYQFDSRGRPYGAVERALEVLGSSEPFRVGNWFATPNARLKGRRPQELLASSPAEVLRVLEHSGAARPQSQAA